MWVLSMSGFSNDLLMPAGNSQGALKSTKSRTFLRNPLWRAKDAGTFFA